MTILELRTAAMRAGFTHYRTMAGLVPMAQFDPYGMAPATAERATGVNWRGAGMREYQGEIVTRADGQTVIRDTSSPTCAPGGFFVTGQFPLVRETFASVLFAAFSDVAAESVGRR